MFKDSDKIWRKIAEIVEKICHCRSQTNRDEIKY